MRGETFLKNFDLSTYTISIHSPHTRGDRNQMQQGFCAIQFQSAPLTRGETA